MTRKFETLEYVVQYCRALFWNAIKRIGLISPCETLEDQQKDAIAPFDEFPSCEICGGVSTSEILITKDGCHIVECNDCGLWFTRPRIKEEIWVEHLKRDTERSREFTENRLKYGVALSSNVKYSPPNWRKRRMKMENHIIDEIERHLGSKISRLHDVGCGVGFLLEAARSRGIEATGNDLNGYACRVMKERADLRVYNDILPDLPLQEQRLQSCRFFRGRCRTSCLKEVTNNVMLELLSFRFLCNYLYNHSIIGTRNNLNMKASLHNHVL